MKKSDQFVITVSSFSGDAQQKIDLRRSVKNMRGIHDLKESLLNIFLNGGEFETVVIVVTSGFGFNSNSQFQSAQTLNA